ncbi:MAG TPA: hypothetical protein VFM58_03255 [Solirubrobacteraceae bacterium]|jgi:hypothetical protein|nr:hypothetical protein [Solirubrobacteraceae bacterium]
MAYASRQARQDLLTSVAEAIDEIGRALAALGDAYDQLDERTADLLEERLFRPLQSAYGRAQRTHAGFAARHDLEGRSFAAAGPGAPSRGVREFVETAAEAVSEADDILADLQDSMLPVEVGDAELRAGLAEVRELLDPLPERAQALLRGFGR